MKLAAPVALLLVAGLVACGSSSVNQRAAIVRVLRASAVKSGNTYVTVHRIHISKLDPQYASAEEWYGGATGPTGYNTWILRRSNSTWRPTSVENMFPDCGAAPPRVLKDLVGSAGCYPPVGVYTSIYWTPGHTARMRYCQRPGGPGNFLAASHGVTCETATAVIDGYTHRCMAGTTCIPDGFSCSPWTGRHEGTFDGQAHAVCTKGPRRIEWDGG